MHRARTCVVRPRWSPRPRARLREWRRTRSCPGSRAAQPARRTSCPGARPRSSAPPTAASAAAAWRSRAAPRTQPGRTGTAARSPGACSQPSRHRPRSGRSGSPGSARLVVSASAQAAARQTGRTAAQPIAALVAQLPSPRKSPAIEAHAARHHRAAGQGGSLGEEAPPRTTGQARAQKVQPPLELSAAGGATYLLLLLLLAAASAMRSLRTVLRRLPREAAGSAVCAVVHRLQPSRRA